ncbi:MAG: hypothetical protein AB8B92_07875 [Gammaproteobacteria bacterium]
MYWKFNKRDSFIVLLILFTFLSLFFIAPIPQDLNYHNFADSRALFGINNFLDVFSNLPFLLVGILGLHYTFKNWGITSSWSWLVFFVSIFFVALGSSYYHLNPENNTLTWDRLPMAIGFMALFVIVVTDYVHQNLGKWLLLPMCLVGILSVIYWHITDDLRFYAWVQFVSMALLLIIIFVYKPNHLQPKYLIYAYIFYALSKLTEYFDKQIFEMIDQLVSGHTIKHLLASIATFCFYILLKRRVN